VLCRGWRHFAGQIVNDAGRLEQQILTYRQMVRMAFELAAAMRRANYSAIAAE
jgi:hypothetical protein